MADTLKHLEPLLIRSGAPFRNLIFPQPIPNSPNALALYKWHKEDVNFACQQLDNIEKDCDIHNVCKKGCNGCCKQLITASDSEMKAISICIQNSSYAEKKLLISKTESTCNTLTTNGFSINSPMATKSVEMQRELQQKYFELNVECPMLSTEGVCLIYEVRPNVCWSYRCYNDPQKCSENFNYNESINYYFIESLVLKRVLTASHSKRGLLLFPFAIKELL